MSDGNDVVYWWNGTHWTHGTAPVPDCPGPPIPGGVVYCGSNTWWISSAGTEGQVFVSHGDGTPTWEDINPAWRIPILTNSWFNYGTTYESAGFRKHLDGTTELKGLVKGGVTGKAIFTLPIGEGLCPKVIEPFIVLANTGVARVDVLPSGVVIVRSYQGSGSNGYVALGGIRFPSFS